MPNSLLAGNIQGISSIRASAARQGQPKTISNQYLKGQFPKHPNREFFAPYRELNRAIRVVFAPIRESRCRPLFRQPPCRQIVSSRQISNVAEKAEQGRRQMLGVAEADLQLEAALSVRKAPQAYANRSPSLSTRTIGVPRLHDGAWSRRARPGCTELTADGGPRVRIHLPPGESRVRTCMLAGG